MKAKPPPPSRTPPPQSDEVKVALARADAQIKLGMDLYKLRNRVACMVGLLSLEDLRELVRLLDALTPDELKDAASYAQGLAAWRKVAPESDHAEVIPGIGQSGS